MSLQAKHVQEGHIEYPWWLAEAFHAFSPNRDNEVISFSKIARILNGDNCIVEKEEVALPINDEA